LLYALRHTAMLRTLIYLLSLHDALPIFLETARGCPFKFNFCSVWKFHESTFREKSPDRVVKELEQIDAPNVFITDDIFWMNVKRDRKSTRLNSSHGSISYAVFCLKKKTK